jgi:hypothetical protein
MNGKPRIGLRPLIQDFRKPLPTRKPIAPG